MAKPLELVGKKFGNLTVLERAENNKNGNTQWLCKCDCGGTKVCLGYDLTHGRTTTCGCSMNLVGKPSPQRISLVGKRYGKLTVESLNEEKSKNGVLVWNCICDCGNKFVARGGNLKCGKATHCGCSKSEFSNNFVDITGNKYGTLTVLGPEGKNDRGVLWRCKCDCGAEVVKVGDDLKFGRTKTCGDHNIHKPNRKRSEPRPDKRLYSEWYTMLNRCSKKYHGKKYYYDKGITVCEEWNDYSVFKTWSLQNGYSDELTLDRIDVNGNYEPNNCRWVDMKVQQNNKTSNVRIAIGDETRTLKEWSEYYDIPYGTVKARRLKGWPVDRLFEPLHKNQYM